jgi:hypothetical protein
MKERKRRIRKTLAERIADCESHLFFLQEALKLFPQQYDRYKPLSGELRVLVCSTRQNKPLLLDLMDELEVDYYIHPPRPPFHNIGIPLVGWSRESD